MFISLNIEVLFQHTAARRRLPVTKNLKPGAYIVSTHSRAEAAALLLTSHALFTAFQHTAARRRLRFPVGAAFTWARFNTQPRGGGC